MAGGEYSSDSVRRILELVRDGDDTDISNDIVVIVGGDWAHPKLGYGFLKSESSTCGREKDAVLADRERIVGRHVSDICKMISKGTGPEELQRLVVEQVPTQVAFVSDPSEDGVKRTLLEMQSRGFGCNEFDVIRYVQRPKLGTGVILSEVYSYWLER